MSDDKRIGPMKCSHGIYHANGQCHCEEMGKRLKKVIDAFVKDPHGELAAKDAEIARLRKERDEAQDSLNKIAKIFTDDSAPPGLPPENIVSICKGAKESLRIFNLDLDKARAHMMIAHERADELRSRIAALEGRLKTILRLARKRPVGFVKKLTHVARDALLATEEKENVPCPFREDSNYDVCEDESDETGVEIPCERATEEKEDTVGFWKTWRFDQDAMSFGFWKTCRFDQDRHGEKVEWAADRAARAGIERALDLYEDALKGEKEQEVCPTCGESKDGGLYCSNAFHLDDIEVPDCEEEHRCMGTGHIVGPPCPGCPDCGEEECLLCGGTGKYRQPIAGQEGHRVVERACPDCGEEE